MTTMLFGYGDQKLGVRAPDGITVIGADLPDREPLLTRAAIEEGLDHPVAGLPLANRFTPGDRVTIVIPDQTRPAAVPLYLSPMLDRLQGATVTVITANGLHRPMTGDELTRLVGPDVAERVTPVNHDADADLAGSGVFLDGEEILLNRRVIDCDRLIVTGACGVHYLAGFGGGRKGIMPGVAARKDILRFHRLSLDPDGPGRHRAIGPASLNGNPMNDLATRVMERLRPTFLLNTIIDRAGRPVKVAAGDPTPAYAAAVDAVKERSVTSVDHRCDVIVASCGGAPKDIDFIQAHKAFDNATRAMSDGGRLFLMAACSDGIGSPTFLPWLPLGSAEAIDARLREPGAFTVNGQTAMATLEKSRRFPTTLLSTLDPATVRAMGMTPATDRDSFLIQAEEALASARRPALFPHAGFVTPFVGERAA